MEQKLAKIFEKRRQELSHYLEEGFALIHTEPLVIRSRDTELPFRPDSNFYYLTGFEEPESALMLSPKSDKPYTLFVRPRDKEQEVWTGKRFGTEGAKTVFGADDAFSIEELDEHVTKAIAASRVAHYMPGYYKEHDRRFFDLVSNYRPNLRNKEKFLEEIKNPVIKLDEMRAIKDETEIAIIKEACDITTKAYTETIKRIKPGVFEYEIESSLNGLFRGLGGRGPAYTSIVGTGNNACVLHYIENNAELKDGDLLLIDAGAEYNMYASDVTRCYPVNGKFSGPQKEIYQAVLNCQKKLVDMIKPGVTVAEMYDATCKWLAEGLIAIGILKGSVEDVVKDAAFKDFFPHKTGHWMGLDVHDSGPYLELDGSSKKLEAGMVLTIEPGLYFPESDERVAPEYRGIGVRIEDDILVTNNGFENLTKNIPKEISDIESQMA